MTPKLKHFLSLVLLLTLFSCLKEEIPSGNEDTILRGSGFKGSLLSVIPLNLAPYNLLPGSKSVSGTAEAFCADSLFMWEKEEQYYAASHKKLFRQIPLRGMEHIYCSVTRGLSRESCMDSVAFAKSYLILIEEFAGDKTYEYIATLFPEYHPSGFNNRSTFLNKPDFSGIILYSDKTGNFLWAEHYRKGRIEPGELLSPDDKNGENTIYLAVYQKLRTKSDDWDETLDELIVVGTKPKPNPMPDPIEDPSEDIISDPRQDENKEVTDETADRGGGGGAIIFTVVLHSSDVKKGNVSGEGTYAKNSNVCITAIPFWGHQFSDWGGTLAGKPHSFSFPISQDITSIAHFTAYDPCMDLLNNKANPLPSMRLAPPGGWNIKGATYGITRRDDKGVPKMHNGVDLHAPVGAPVYAMFGGVIGKCVSGQPNKIKEGKEMVYPPGYNGDKNGAGNRIFINSIINGEEVSTGYWHLMAGDPIAVNPRTGKPFRPGDEVFPGELIGYAGHTGNASADVPHLHLNMSRNGKSINPAEYLNAVITTTSVLITTPCDK